MALLALSSLGDIASASKSSTRHFPKATTNRTLDWMLTCTHLSLREDAKDREDATRKEPSKRDLSNKRADRKVFLVRSWCVPHQTQQSIHTMA